MAHLRALTARQQRIVLAAITEQLSNEPTVPTRNRKQMRPNPLALWELRVGDLRVYYDIDEEELVVDIRAVGVKEGNQVLIGGEIVEL
ncbi:type II toxin-antitoxin system RelE/ParE family toxin [Iningainema sp. BLCCT55]|uniref:Type II toxin-antitoxin system RelE/ParE family toxin n=1 Tax=Iningainema tapete BLCC-T55 TaxID=2748662 RepID=A0A8J6XJE2_9CYAN|nr:type II toxin-antitoxin system RelE/ParE family toxin [Iningainema tapete BLCC-T55]